MQEQMSHTGNIRTCASLPSGDNNTLKLHLCCTCSGYSMDDMDLTSASTLVPFSCYFSSCILLQSWLMGKTSCVNKVVIIILKCFTRYKIHCCEVQFCGSSTFLYLSALSHFILLHWGLFTELPVSPLPGRPTSDLMIFENYKFHPQHIASVSSVS